MTEKAKKRSGMLGSIYQILPDIDDDYAAKLVYLLENKKTLPDFRQEMKTIFDQLNQPHLIADTIVAKILLDEITMAAAMRQLHLRNQTLTIMKLSEVIPLNTSDTDLLVAYYTSCASEHDFDADFATALKQIPNPDGLTDTEKVKSSLESLIKTARQTLENNPQRSSQNAQAIYQMADKYQLSFRLSAALIQAYTLEGAADFTKRFTPLFDTLQTIQEDAKLNASLTARTLLNQLTQQDAQDITLTSKLLKGTILEEDLVTIACRYLKQKKPQDIVDTFQAVLKRLPHAKQEEENIGLAVQVLLSGTEPMFQQAQQTANLRRDRIVLHHALAKKHLFAGYEQALANKYAGQKNAEQLDKQAQHILQTLPEQNSPASAHALVCQVLLGQLTQEQAMQLAQSQASEIK